VSSHCQPTLAPLVAEHGTLITLLARRAPHPHHPPLEC
jgi:hypothetical protein